MTACASVALDPSPSVLSAQAVITSAASARAADSAGADLRLARDKLAKAQAAHTAERPRKGQRAAMVGEVLHAAGIASDRMSMRGMGEGNPAASNQSAEGRAINRRVEIVLSEAMGPMHGR